jgi:CDP-diacylglycerol pyrophosphatase
MSVVPRSLHIKLILLSICVIAVVAQAIIIDNDVDARPLEPEILERVVVEDVELSGMTRSQAEEALYQYVDEIVLQPIVLTSGDEAWLLDPTCSQADV